MKKFLPVIAISFGTSALTVFLTFWVLWHYPLRLPANTLPDGNIEKPSIDIFSGETRMDVYAPNGNRLYALVQFKNSPDNKSILYAYNNHTLIRKDVFTTPVSGISRCQVYTPSTPAPVASYLRVSGEPDKYFDAGLNEISFGEFQAIRGIFLSENSN